MKELYYLFRLLSRVFLNLTNLGKGERAFKIKIAPLRLSYEYRALLDAAEGEGEGGGNFGHFGDEGVGLALRIVLYHRDEVDRAARHEAREV